MNDLLNNNIKLTNIEELYYQSLKKVARLYEQFRNLISKLRRKIESTFNQLAEHFDIERVRVNSMLGLSAMLEVKFLCFNILVYIGGSISQLKSSSFLS